MPLMNSTGTKMATEVMVVNSAISNLIREGKTHQIPGMIQVGKRLGNPRRARVSGASCLM